MEDMEPVPVPSEGWFDEDSFNEIWKHCSEEDHC